MNSEEYAHIFRIITIVVVLMAWYALSQRTGARWQNMTRLGKRLWVWYYILLFAVAYLSLNAFRNDRPLSSGNYILLFALAGLTIAALLKLNGDESTEPVYRVQMKGKITTWRVQKLR